MHLQVRPLGITPDGTARWLVRALFNDARGKPSKLLKGGDVAFTASGGEVQWQTRMRFDAPSAMVSTRTNGPLAMGAQTNAELGALSAHAADDTRRWRLAHVCAGVLGPHLVQIGWFPQQRHGTTMVVRSGPDGTRVVGLIGSPSSTYRDTTVQPGMRYRYTVIRKQHGNAGRDSLQINVPLEPAAVSVRAVGGKGMWLSFSPDRLDDNAYTKLNPRRIVDRAVHAGLHFIELRTAYGAFWEITQAAKPRIDALIDEATRRGIAVIGWTVPRKASFEDLSASVATAYYSTPHGTHFAGLAVDAERGEAFMGNGPRGYAALTDYMHFLHTALGPRYPIIATIEDPYVENLTNKEYPYKAIAANAGVLQPMVYWSVLSARPMTPASVRATMQRSYEATLREARYRIPIDMGGQTAAFGSHAPPSPQEITASLDASRRLGAIGEAFFDWNATSEPQWNAIKSYPWEVWDIPMRSALTSLRKYDPIQSHTIGNFILLF